VTRHKARKLLLTAPAKDVPEALDANAKSLLQYSAMKCGYDLTEYCRPIFASEVRLGLHRISAIDQSVAEQAVADFMSQTKSGGLYNLGTFYDAIVNHPQSKELRREFLSLTKPGYEIGLPRQLGTHSTLGFRNPRAIEPEIALLPVPPEYASTEFVLTSLGFDVLADIGYCNVLDLRASSEFRKFIVAKANYVKRCYAREWVTDFEKEFVSATREYLLWLDEKIRSLQGLSQRGSVSKYGIQLTRFRQQLTPTNCVRGVVVGFLGAAATGVAYYAGREIFDSASINAASLFSGSMSILGMAAPSANALDAVFAITLSSKELSQIEQASSELWLDRPFQITSYFGSPETIV